MGKLRPKRGFKIIYATIRCVEIGVSLQFGSGVPRSGSFSGGFGLIRSRSYSMMVRGQLSSGLVCERLFQVMFQEQLISGLKFCFHIGVPWILGQFTSFGQYDVIIAC